MFTDLDLINRFNIDYFTLCRYLQSPLALDCSVFRRLTIFFISRWLCSVRRNYRSVTYHNWRHAFNVCQVDICQH